MEKKHHEPKPHDEPEHPHKPETPTKGYPDPDDDPQTESVDDPGADDGNADDGGETPTKPPGQP